MSHDLSLSTALVEELAVRLGGEPPKRPLSPRPVHVLYGGAHLFTAASPEKIGARARSAMEAWGADDLAFGNLVGARDEALARAVAERVRAKLMRAPVEAMCIDFEDGYGPRTDEEEDHDAHRAALELANVPPSTAWIGIRIKALAAPTVRRAIRTLDQFVTTFARATSCALRPHFTVTLPKVTRPSEVAAFGDLLDALESSLRIPRIGVELMIESPRALLEPRGALALPALIEAGRGRIVAVHLGAYDLTAELGVTAGDQRLDHPICDLARMLLQLSVPEGVAVSDGATTVLPIAPTEAPPEQRRAAVHRAWELHSSNVRRAIDVGIWQGWDLHPAQLPIRYGVLFAYFLARRVDLAERLRTFVERATQASRVGQVFDDAATGRALVEFFLRGVACGALDEEDVRATTLTTSELQEWTFVDIARRRSRS